MQIWQVLVSSPSDVRDERDALTRVVHTVNLALEASGKELRLELRKWEDVPPGLHEDGGQGQIESTLHFGDSDILIGIFWKRFGTPVLGKLSGTEREIRLGCEAFRSAGRPKVMVFFCTAPHQTRNREDLEQLAKVLAFEEELKSQGLVQEYSDAREFEALAIRHLLVVCLGATEAQRYLSSPLECAVLGSHVIVRTEGLMERVGDLQLFFSIDHAFAAAAIKKATHAGPPDPNIFRAWLAIEKPSPNPLLVDIDVTLSNDIIWAGGVIGPILLFGQADSISRHRREGRRMARNRVRFEDVPIDLNMLLTSVTITNIRTNALRLGIAGSGYLQTIIANVRARDGFKDVTIKDVNVTLASLNNGTSLWFTTEPPSPLKLPVAEITKIRLDKSQTEVVAPTITLRLGEGFPGAFKTRAEEAGISALPMDQVANSGTLLTLSLRWLPEGIAVYAAAKGQRDKMGSPAVRMVGTKRDVLGFAGDTARPVVTSSSGIELVYLDVIDRSAEAVWEWISSEPAKLASSRSVELELFIASTTDAPVETRSILATVALGPMKFTIDTNSLPIPSFGISRGEFTLLSIE